jgi:aromatic ring-cleaving dioxygenase
VYTSAAEAQEAVEAAASLMTKPNLEVLICLTIILRYLNPVKHFHALSVRNEVAQRTDLILKTLSVIVTTPHSTPVWLN